MNEDCPFTEEQLEWLSNNLTLDVSEESHYNYCGGSGDMYTYSKVVKLLLNGNIISYISFT